MSDERAVTIHRARLLRSEGDLAAARKLVEAGCNEFPDAKDWRMELAHQYLSEGDRDAALDLFAQLGPAEEFGGNLECLLKSAELLADRGDRPASLEMLATAETRYPWYEGLASVRSTIATRTVSSASRDQVVQSVAAIRSGPPSAPALNATITSLQSYLEEAPGDLEIGLELGRLLGLAHRYREAIPVLQKLSRATAFSGQLESLVALARAHAAIQDFSEAWQAVETVRADFPGHAAYLTLVAELGPRCRPDADLVGIIRDGLTGLLPEHRSEGLHVFANATAVQIFDHALNVEGFDGETLSRPGSPAVYERAGMIILTKDEADFLGHNLEHHYRLGFRNFCIIDNQSTDGTAVLVSSFRQRHPDSLVLYCYDQIAGHYQADKMSVFMDAFARYARIAQVALDWMFFVDTDELISPVSHAARNALHDAMQDSACNVIVFHWLLCASTVPLRATPLDVSPFVSFDMVKALQPPATKVAVRLSSGCRATEGNHWVHGAPGTLSNVWIAADHGWFMFHFTIRSFDQLKSKVVNGGRAFLGTKGLETHGGHWKYNYERYLDEGDHFIERLLRDHVRSTAIGGSRLSRHRSVPSNQTKAETEPHPGHTIQSVPIP